VSVHRGGETLGSVVSIAVLIVVSLVVLVVAAALGWWLLSVLVHPLPYSDPEAIGATSNRWS
jgi:hypothetical protein